MYPVQETKHTNHNSSQLYVAELNQYYKPLKFISLDYKQSTAHQTSTLIIPKFMQAVTRHRTQLLQLSGIFQNQTSFTTLPLFPLYPYYWNRTIILTFCSLETKPYKPW